MKKIILFILVFISLIQLVSAIDIASDDFESNSFSGGIGWNDVWVTSGGCEISSLGNPIGDYYLRARSSCIATRYFDNTEYANNKLTFYAGASSLENPDHCYYSYYNGTDYIQLLQLDNGDDDGVLRYYSFDINPSNIIGIRVETSSSQSGDYCYLDNVLSTGDILTPELHIYNELNYQKNSLINVDMTSSLTNTEHQFIIFFQNNTIICNETIISPSVKNTVFTEQCQLPDITQNNVYMKLQTEGANLTKSFNIVDKQNNPEILDINRVYFSKQVLQGGSTEIFAVIDTNLTIDDVYVIITFPDNTTRKLSMDETYNNNEYRAYITDTFQTTNTTFKIYVESGIYYATYENSYYVAPYNIDFVDTVNNVNSILSQPPNIDVLGTYYEVGDTGKVIAQLSNQGVSINNATCFTSIYKPDDSVFLRNVLMNYVEDSDGLYTYDVVIPDYVGVWAISVVCDYITSEEDIYPYNINYIFGYNQTDNISKYFYADNITETITSETNGTEEKIKFDTFFNISTYNISDNSDLFLKWQGSSTFPSPISISWYCDSNSTWFKSNNEIIDTSIEQSFELPDCINISNVVNSSHIIRINFNGSTTSHKGVETFFYENFEDSNIDPFTENTIDGTPVYGTNLGGINGTNAYISGSNDGNEDIGVLTTTVNASNYTNLTLSYSRYTSGSESDELHYVSIQGGNIYHNLTEDWETGDFNSQDSYWAENSWHTSGTADVYTNSHSGNYALRLRNDDGWVDRGIDFSEQIGDVIISFWAKTNSFENNEYSYFYVETSPNSDTYTTLHTWVNGDDDNTWHYFEFNLSDYPGITLGSNTEIAFESDMSGSGDYFYVDDIKVQMYGNHENILESWYANSPLTTKTYSLSSDYDNIENLTINFYSHIDYDNDYMGFDDVRVEGHIYQSYYFTTDILSLTSITPNGVVNEVRGGGEFNVKDRIKGIEDSLDNIENNMGISTEKDYVIKYTMPRIYGIHDTPLLSLYLYEINKPSTGITGADCTATIRGTANATSIGEVKLTEYPLIDNGGGIYYAIPSMPNASWDSGIYQIETNCEILGEGTYYGVEGFRMEKDYSDYLIPMNITINDINLSLTNMSDEIPGLMIGGTEYESGEEGLVAVRLIKTKKNTQTIITGAICNTDILYPNQTLFVDDGSMTEYGDGVYYYNFTAPEIEGVYIYSINCSKSSKTYFAMNTFHISPLANSREQMFKYLNNINNTVNNIYSIIQDVDSILDEINYTVNNINVSVNLTGIETSLLNLREAVDDSSDFSKEAIFLVTDSIVATERAKTTNDTKQIVAEMGIVKEKLTQLKSETKTTNSRMDFMGGFFLLFVAIFTFIFIVKKKDIRRSKKCENIS